MADRPFIFRAYGKEVTLPVTPNLYDITTGKNLELINIHQLGDVILAGYKKITPFEVEFLLPADDNDYNFDNGTLSQAEYIKFFKKLAVENIKPRFIIGGTKINIKAFIEDFSESEKDGTNDVYARISMSEAPDLEAPKYKNTNTVKKASRSATTEKKTSTDYVIQKGDTLSALCRKYYGSAAPEYYNKLAAYNGISNPHMIYTGNSLKLPQPLL